ncbi:MAG: energy transducer TonB [Pseudomonadota bacterium]
MKKARHALLLWSILACSHVAIAEKPKAGPTPPVPQGTPGEWVTPEDYPIPALRLGMIGTTSFVLAVDVKGKTTGCEITDSSGFDILDEATCKLLMARATFSPSRDRAGKAQAASYRNRVRWMIPGDMHAIGENWTSVLMSVDQTGHPTSCKMVITVPNLPNRSQEGPCSPNMAAPPELGPAVRGDYAGSSAQIELQQADVFTPELRERLLAPRSGYEQRGLNVYRFTVGKDGKMDKCSYVEQRGNVQLVTDYCGQARSITFDPPFSAFDKDGVATGWHIIRALLKSAP